MYKGDHRSKWSKEFGQPQRCGSDAYMWRNEHGRGRV